MAPPLPHNSNVFDQHHHRHNHHHHHQRHRHRQRPCPSNEPDLAMPVDVHCSSTSRPYSSFLRKLLPRHRQSNFRPPPPPSRSICASPSPCPASHSAPSSSSSPARSSRAFSFGSAKDLQVIFSSFSTTLRRQASCGKSRLSQPKHTPAESLAMQQFTAEATSGEPEICRKAPSENTPWKGTGTQRLRDAAADLALQNDAKEEKAGRKRMKQRSNSEAMVHIYCADVESDGRDDESSERLSLSRSKGREGAEAPSATTAQACLTTKKKKHGKSNPSLCDLQRVVALLKEASHGEERWRAAEEVRKMTKEDPIARITMAMLGAIPPLISMLDAEADPKQQCAALLALLNLAIGNETNKAAIVKGKAVPKMVALLGSPDADVQAAVVTAFLSLSALEGNKAAIGSSSGAIASLVSILSQEGDEHRRKDALRALYNLSIHPANVKTIVESGGAPLLLAMVEDVEMSEKALATLGNFATTDVGREAISRHKEIGYAVLVDALRWSEAPRSQERAAYILMMIAHHSQAQREAMASAGAITALLELVLLGTPLAQKRASKTLESFRRAKAFSAPQQYSAAHRLGHGGGSSSVGGAGEGRFVYCAARTCTAATATAERTMSERTVVDSLVRQSLHRTMQRIVRRANIGMGGIMIGEQGSEDAPSSSIAATSAVSASGVRRVLDRRIRSSSSLPY